MKIKSAIIALTVGASVLTACGGSQRWCEFDSTDQVVADSFCKAGAPGYEWETGSDSTKRKHQRSKVKSSVKPPVYRAPAPQRGTTKRTTTYKAPTTKKR